MEFKIGNRMVGGENPVFVIAELSANHLNDFDLAVKTVKAMKDSGADAVKLQTFTPETITMDCDNDFFKIHQECPWKGQNLYQLYQEAYMPWEWQPKLKKITDKLDLILLSSPFDFTAVDFLEKMKVPAYKIASFEITDLPLIEYVASMDKPIILSTGVADVSDIEKAIDVCKKVDNHDISLLKCTSSYPAPLDSLNLRTIPHMAQTFNAVVGLSDHTLEEAVPLGAVALGAKIIEKHFILKRDMGGPDSLFSMEPIEFKKMVNSIKVLEQALGVVKYDLSELQGESKNFSRSIFVVKDVDKGEKFTDINLKILRPGYGLHPQHLKELLGKKAKKNIKKGTPLNWELVQ